jgi:hypothetical protein
MQHSVARLTKPAYGFGVDSAPLSNEEISRLQVVAARFRKARDDADEALVAVETLIELGTRRLPSAPVTPIRPGGDRDLAGIWRTGGPRGSSPSCPARPAPNFE